MNEHKVIGATILFTTPFRDQNSKTGEVKQKFIISIQMLETHSKNPKSQDISPSSLPCVLKEQRSPGARVHMHIPDLCKTQPRAHVKYKILQIQSHSSYQSPKNFHFLQFETHHPLLLFSNIFSNMF